MLLILRAWLSVESRVDTAVRVLIANFPAVKLLIKTITPPQLSFPLASLPLHLRGFSFCHHPFSCFSPLYLPHPCFCSFTSCPCLPFHWFRLFCCVCLLVSPLFLHSKVSVSFSVLPRLQEDPPTGVSGAPSENNIMLWNAVIFGWVIL